MPPSKRRKIILEDENSDDDVRKSRSASLHMNLSFTSNVDDSGHGSFDKNQNTPRSHFQKTHEPNSAQSAPKKERILPRIINIQKRFASDDQVHTQNCTKIRDDILRKTSQFFHQESELVAKTKKVLQEASNFQKDDETSTILEKGASHLKDAFQKADTFQKKEDSHEREDFQEKDLHKKADFHEKEAFHEKTIHLNDTSPEILYQNSAKGDSSLEILESNSSPGEDAAKKRSAKKVSFEKTCGKQNPEPKSHSAGKSPLNIKSPSNQKSLLNSKQKSASPKSVSTSGSKSFSNSSSKHFSNSVPSGSTFQPEPVFDSKTKSAPASELKSSSSSSSPKDRELQQNSRPEAEKKQSVRLALREDQQVTMSPKTTDLVSVNEMKTPLSGRFLASRTRRTFSSKRRLFRDENHPENCEPSPQTPAGTVTLASPILGNSVKKRKLFSLQKIRKEDNRKSVSFQGVPLSCSSFVEKSPSSQPAMEMTTIANILPITVRSSAKKADVQKTLSQDKRVLSMELTEVKGDILEGNSLRNEDSLSRTARTSLNVNTSLDTEQEKSNEKARSSRDATHIDDLSEAKSIIESTVNESESTTNRKHTFKLKLMSRTSSTDYVDSECAGSRSSKGGSNCFLKPGEKRYSTGSAETSCIEGTPYPVSRSFMLKSQIRQNTFPTQLNCDFLSGNSSRESQTKGSKKFREARHPALEGSESREMNSSFESQGRTTSGLSKTSRTEESSDSLKRGKKRLYPIRNHSQPFSLSPAKSLTPSPKRTVFPPRRINKKWKKVLEAKQKQIETQKSLEGESQKTPKRGTKKKAEKTQKDKTQKEKTQTKTQEGRTQKEQSQDSEDTGDDFDSTSDEEADLSLKSVKRKKPRRVLRKKIVMKPLPGTSTQRKRKTRIRTLIEDEERRSSLSDFEPEKKKPKEIVKIYIVVTGFSNDDKNMIKGVVKSLGKAKIEANISRKTTHVVSTGVRTINLLKGILRGCWLVCQDWVLKSMSEGNWLNPEPYEMPHFAAAVKENRKDRKIFGNAFVSELFANCGLIYVESGTSPAPSALKDLIKTAGGRITEELENAKIKIGPQGLKEIWVLDSITTGKIQPVKQYKRK